MPFILKLSQPRHLTQQRTSVRDSDSCHQWPPVFHSDHHQGKHRAPDVFHELGEPHSVKFCLLVSLRFVAAFSLTSFFNTLIFDLLFHFWVIMIMTTTGRVACSSHDHCSLKPRGLSVAHSIALQSTFKNLMFKFCLSRHGMVWWSSTGIFLIIIIIVVLTLHLLGKKDQQ